MKIQVNSDKQIRVDTKAIRSVEEELTRALEQFAGQLTRVEVHLSDLNSSKPGLRDKRCRLEVRPAGKNPVSTSSDAGTIEQAVKDAAGKMKRLLQSSLGRAAHQTSRASLSGGKRSVQSDGTIEKLGRIETTLAELFDESGEISPAIAKQVRTATDALQRARVLVEAKQKGTEESGGATGAAAKRTPAVAKRAGTVTKRAGTRAKQVSADGRSPKKKGTYRARRKSWPKR